MSMVDFERTHNVDLFKSYNENIEKIFEIGVSLFSSGDFVTCFVLTRKQFFCIL